MILVGTHSDQPHADYPEKTLLADFPQITKTFTVSSATGAGLAALKEEMARQARELPMMGLRWPATWWEAFQAVKALGQESNCADVNAVYREIPRHGLEAEEDSPSLDA